MFRQLSDKEHGYDIMQAMLIINNLSLIDKAYLKRVLVIGIHNLTSEERNELINHLQEMMLKKNKLEEV